LIDNLPAEASIIPAQEIQGSPEEQRAVVTLPDAVRECVLNNMKLKAGEEKVRSAQADYLSESLIPNSQLFVDAQLLPLSALDVSHQGGPPEYDAFLTVPIDGFLFGKRVAAQSAARLNVDVAQAELADLIRKQIAQTVDSFYDALEANLALKLAEQRLATYQHLENVAKERKKGKESSSLEQRRISLTILDIQREIRKGRATIESAKSKLRANMGRPPDAPDFVVEGTLAVRAIAPALTAAQAWVLAEQHRPDLIAARRAIDAARAAISREERRAFPQVAISPGVDYQDQLRITGFRNPWLWTAQVTTTLPLTDRNQGHVMLAQAQLRSAQANLMAALTDARAEVEQATAEYTEAADGITNEDVASLRTAREVLDETVAEYRKGDKTLIDALDAENGYRDRQRAYLANLADYWQALNHVNAAIGLRVRVAVEADRDQVPDDGRGRKKDSGNGEPSIRQAVGGTQTD
jgi:cobalt-zinc-cadmium efflux system outer membrane protein